MDRHKRLAFQCSYLSTLISETSLLCELDLQCNYSHELNLWPSRKKRNSRCPSLKGSHCLNFLRMETSSTFLSLSSSWPSINFSSYVLSLEQQSYLLPVLSFCPHITRPMPRFCLRSKTNPWRPP